MQMGVPAQGSPETPHRVVGTRSLSPIMMTLRMKLLISCRSWGPKASSSPATTSTQPTTSRYRPGSGANPNSFRGKTSANRTNSDFWEGWEESGAALSLGLGGTAPPARAAPLSPAPRKGSALHPGGLRLAHPEGLSPAPQHPNLLTSPREGSALHPGTPTGSASPPQRLCPAPQSAQPCTPTCSPPPLRAQPCTPAPRWAQPCTPNCSPQFPNLPVPSLKGSSLPPRVLIPPPPQGPPRHRGVSVPHPPNQPSPGRSPLPSRPPPRPPPRSPCAGAGRPRAAPRASRRPSAGRRARAGRGGR